jgi:hypothetical protein
VKVWPDAVKDRKERRKKLGGSDKINVLGSLFLKSQQDFFQTLLREDFSQTFLTDGIVLAVAAFQCTAGEEDGAASALTGQTGFLPQVKGSPGCGKKSAASTDAWTGPAVGMAHAGAEGAVLIEDLECGKIGCHGIPPD